MTLDNDPRVSIFASFSVKLPWPSQNRCPQPAHAALTSSFLPTGLFLHPFIFAKPLHARLRLVRSHPLLILAISSLGLTPASNTAIRLTHRLVPLLTSFLIGRFLRPLLAPHHRLLALPLLPYLSYTLFRFNLRRLTSKSL